jgi:hypothetical protein
MATLSLVQLEFNKVQWDKPLKWPLSTSALSLQHSPTLANAYRGFPGGRHEWGDLYARDEHKQAMLKVFWDL